MGTLRFFLALSIIVAHAGPVFGVWLVDPRLAVQMFYLMSGFSMAFVWQGKYAASQSPARTFFASRALRIYPQYFLVLIPTILLSVYAWLAQNRHPIATALQDPIGGLGGLWIYLQQVVVLGMESHLFLQRAADGTLAVCLDFHRGLKPELHQYMFVPQAWMLSLQLVFYMLTPLLLPRPRLCLATLVASFAARVIFWQAGLNSDPWTHRFLPFELGVFLLGVYAFRLHQGLAGRCAAWLSRAGWGWGGLIGLSGLLLALPWLRNRLGEAAYWICLMSALPVLPFLFQSTMKRKWDRYLGELSYPIYIAHLLIMWVGEFLLGVEVENLVYFTLPATLPAAVGLNVLQSRIDAYRHSLVRR